MTDEKTTTYTATINGRSHGYRLRPDGKWESWFESPGVSFGTQQEAMAWLVVEMHREDTND